MNYSQRSNELKLDILESLARSQRAISCIIENVADVTSISDKTARHVLENLDVITKYQHSIANKLCSIREVRIKKGKPSTPWLNRSIVKKI
jgi:hypothetical protein